MIRLASVKESHSPENREWLDQKWYISHSLDKSVVVARHFPELGPGPSLFAEYEKTLQDGSFDREWLHVRYVSWFLNRMNGKVAKQLLERLCTESHTKNILLVCYCEDELLCHRSIVGGLLLGMGADIETNPQYAYYYHRYMKYHYHE